MFLPSAVDLLLTRPNDIHILPTHPAWFPITLPHSTAGCTFYHRTTYHNTNSLQTRPESHTEFEAIVNTRKTTVKNPESNQRNISCGHFTLDRKLVFYLTLDFFLNYPSSQVSRQQRKNLSTTSKRAK